MGAFKGEVLCDIMPMDICPMMLGRSWCFERFA